MRSHFYLCLHLYLHLYMYLYLHLYLHLYMYLYLHLYFVSMAKRNVKLPRSLAVILHSISSLFHHLFKCHDCFQNRLCVRLCLFVREFNFHDCFHCFHCLHCLYKDKVLSPVPWFMQLLFYICITCSKWVLVWGE